MASHGSIDSEGAGGGVGLTGSDETMMGGAGASINNGLLESLRGRERDVG